MFVGCGGSVCGRRVLGVCVKKCVEVCLESVCGGVLGRCMGSVHREGMCVCGVCVYGECVCVFFSDLFLNEKAESRSINPPVCGSLPVLAV